MKTRALFDKIPRQTYASAPKVISFLFSEEQRGLTDFWKKKQAQIFGKPTAAKNMPFP